jgi:hypothetical protein
MENKTFHQHLVQWNMMPGDLEEQEYFMNVYPAPLDAKFHALSALYLEGSPQQQRDLTDFFASGTAANAADGLASARFDNAIIYMRRVARCLGSVSDSSLLRLGLAAAAWTERRTGNHDLLISLAFLYHAAARSGIDPVPYFDTIASTAGPQSQAALQAFLHCDVTTVRRMVQHYEGTC